MEKFPVLIFFPAPPTPPPPLSPPAPVTENAQGGSSGSSQKECRRDQEEGVVLDPQVSPEEIKSREVELGLRVGLLSLQLFPNGGATDIVFVTLFCIAVGTAITWCDGGCAMPDGHCRNILLFWRRSTVALVFRVGACFEVSLFCPPFPLVPVPNRPTRLRGF